jgi:hypothetical protein
VILQKNSLNRLPFTIRDLTAGLLRFRTDNVLKILIYWRSITHTSSTKLISERTLTAGSRVNHKMRLSAADETGYPCLRIYWESKMVKSLFRTVADFVSRFRKPEPVSPTDDGLAHLAAYECVYFTRLTNGQVYFVHGSEQFHFDMPQESAAVILNDLQKQEGYFTALWDQGVNEVAIPENIMFHPLSGRFSEITHTKPTTRKPSANCSTSEGLAWIVTKDKVSMTSILDEYREIIEEFTAAATAPAARMTAQLTAPVA